MKNWIGAAAVVFAVGPAFAADVATCTLSADKKTVAYFESARGRSFIRSTLRRSRVVEQLVESWLAAHPGHPGIPHLEDDAPSGVGSSLAEGNAAITATDRSSVVEAHASPIAAG